MATDLLTAEEHALIADLGHAAEEYGRITHHGPSRPGDVAEFVGHIHALQCAVMAQAAARAYPDLYRLAGEGEDEESSHGG